MDTGASSRSTVNVSSPSRSSIIFNLERVICGFDKVAAAHANLVTAHQVVPASSDQKTRLVTSLAARIQAVKSVQETAVGDNVAKVRTIIARLTTEMLDLEMTN